jgi:hypothetical protein
MSPDTTLLAALARLQAALVLLSACGEVVLMGPVYALVPLAVAAVLLRSAAVVRRTPARPTGPRRTLRLLVGIEAVALATVPLSLLVSATRVVTWTPTMTGLVTTVVLPAAVLVLARRARTAVPT